MIERITYESQCLKGYRRNSKVRKDKVGIPMFKRTG